MPLPFLLVLKRLNNKLFVANKYTTQLLLQTHLPYKTPTTLLTQAVTK